MVRPRLKALLNLRPHGWISPDERYDHPERRRLRLSRARIKWLAAGRRSGKTEDGMDHILIGHGPRDLVTGLPMFRGALTAPSTIEDPTYVVALPTYQMFRRIWWEKLKRRVPRALLYGPPNETRMELRYANGARLFGVGLDSPTRAEGIPIDGLIVDEFAYVKENAWRRSLRPALSTRGRPPGWAILQGKPAGRNHFHKGYTKASDGVIKNHEAFWWPSSVIMHPDELAQARIDEDQVSYAQEYEASFESYVGLVYHTFGPRNRTTATYRPDRPLAFAWDFGTSPGTVAVCQVHDMPATHCHHCGDPRPSGVGENDSWVCQTCRTIAYAVTPCLVVIGEAYQLTGSTTRALCDELIVKWATQIAKHSPLFCYGDPSGFASSTRGRSTDWDEIEETLGRHFADVRVKVPRAQPPARDRVNALLRLCRSAAGQVRLFVNPTDAPHTWQDFENTVLKPDGSGEIDKKAAGGLYSHLSDAIAYLALQEFPRRSQSIESEVVGAY